MLRDRALQQECLPPQAPDVTAQIQDLILILSTFVSS